MRVVPNLYAAFERQEVVIHAPEHVTSFADLSADQIALVAEAWRRRSEGARYVHALINEGAEAGASREHSHSQLVWLDAPPPAVASETGAFAFPDELVIERREGVVAAAAAAPRQPYEMVIAPVEPEGGAFASERLAPALQLLRACIGRLRAAGVEGAWNAWLHDGPHWHLELLPRLTPLAGIELGAGVYVSTLAPEGAAHALRAVKV